MKKIPSQQPSYHKGASQDKKRIFYMIEGNMNWANSKAKTSCHPHQQEEKQKDRKNDVSDSNRSFFY